MLKRLYIKNYTLIDTLDVEFGEGFSVITGETGAGKSIILGALGLAIGERADVKAIKDGAGKCIVEASFDISGYGLESLFADADIDYDATDCILRREISSNGKSRAYVNDTPAPLTFVKMLGTRLVDIHSQHRNLILGRGDFQLSVLDAMAHDDAIFGAYRRAYGDYKASERELAELKETVERNRANAEMLQYQYAELSALKLTEGEQASLEQQADAMTHAEEIKEALYTTYSMLYDEEHGAVDSTLRSARDLNGIARVLPMAESLSRRLDSIHIELKDIASEVDTLLERTDFDPSEQERVSSRLDKIYTAEKKYHVDSDEALIAFCEDVRLRLESIECSDDELEVMRKRVETLHDECMKAASLLHDERAGAVPTVEGEMASRLAMLGMPNVMFRVELGSCEPSADGCDEVTFLFSANANIPPREISEVASGGEVSRVMLALKAMISSAVSMPTIIFDEIDTGVSGAVAGQMASAMREIAASGRQVISITHLPQIAALGTRHYKVYKDDGDGLTTTRMSELTGEERVCEIAAMLSGSEVTGAAMDNARQLLGEKSYL